MNFTVVTLISKQIHKGFCDVMEALPAIDFQSHLMRNFADIIFICL